VYVYRFPSDGDDEAEQLLRYDKYNATTGRCEITPKDYCRRIENSE
jgi:hypothetical protein